MAVNELKKKEVDPLLLRDPIIINMRKPEDKTGLGYPESRMLPRSAKKLKLQHRFIDWCKSSVKPLDERAIRTAKTILRANTLAAIARYRETVEMPWHEYDRSKWQLHPNLVNQICNWIRLNLKVEIKAELFADNDNAHFLDRIKPHSEWPSNVFIWTNIDFSRAKSTIDKAIRRKAKLVMIIPDYADAVWREKLNRHCIALVRIEVVIIVCRVLMRISLVHVSSGQIS